MKRIRLKMTENAVFIFVAAGNCGGCIRFKQHFWDKTRAELNKIGGVRVIEINITKLGDPLPPDAHGDLQRFVSWYPTFILASKASYDKNRIEGIVYNGVDNKMGKCDLVAPGERKPVDHTSIVAWVKEQMTHNSIFKKGVNFSSLGVKGILKAPKQDKIAHDSDSDDDIYTSTYCQQAFLPFN